MTVYAYVDMNLFVQIRNKMPLTLSFINVLSISRIASLLVMYVLSYDQTRNEDIFYLKVSQFFFITFSVTKVQVSLSTSFLKYHSSNEEVHRC